MRPGLLNIVVLSFLQIFLGATIASSAVMKQPSSTHVPDQIIVKFHPQAGQAIDAAIREKVFPQTGIASLDELFLRYKVIEIKPIFGQGPSLEEIKKKFPQRAQRAPKDVQPPDLRFTYTLTLADGVNINEAVGAFSKDEHVVYAQLNYIATILKTGDKK